MTPEPVTPESPRECSPFDVLLIPRDASVQRAREAANQAVRELSNQPGSEWILNMKIAAYAAVVAMKTNEDPYEHYQQVRRPERPKKVFRHSRPARKTDDLAAETAGTTTTPATTPRARSSGEEKGDSAGSSGTRGATSKRAAKSGGTPKEKEKKYWWQVKKGPTGRRRWGWMDDDIHSRLEGAYGRGLNETTATINGWTYHYDLVGMTQTSPNEAETVRQIRRVICDGDDEEGWTVRKDAVMDDLD